MNRRQFTQSFVALGSVGAGFSLAAMPDTGGAVHFVCDTRIAEFNMLGLATRIAPANYHAFDGDVARVWLDVRNKVWRDSHAPTAGFTRYAEFFVLSTLARDHGYRIAATDEQAQYLSWLLVCDGESGAESLWLDNGILHRRNQVCFNRRTIAAAEASTS